MKTLLYWFAVVITFEVLAMEEPASDFNVAYQVSLGSDPTRALLDVYAPGGASGVPVLIFWHGGALSAGDKQVVRRLAQALVGQGILVVAANYRLSPEVRHPAHLEDAAAAVHWVMNSIENYGGDPNQIFLSGHSAGGYLAVQLALDPRYLERHSLGGSDITGVAAISPFLYVEEVAPKRPKIVWGDDPSGWIEPSVRDYVGPGKPSIRLIYAEDDAPWRRRQNERLAKDLTGFSVDAKAEQVLARDHLTIMSEANHASDPVVNAIARFIQHGE